MKNCLGCRKFSTCDDPRKSGSYNCKGWQDFKSKGNTSTLDGIFGKPSRVSSLEDGEDHRDYDDFLKPAASGFDGFRDYRASELNLNKMMDEVFGENASPWPKDMKVDDRDLPEFANVYEYFFDKDWGLVKSMKPFSRQLWLGMKAFGDYCPRCSNKKFVSDIHNVPVNMRAVDFPEHVQFLKFGVCPKCKSRKSEMVKRGEMNYVRELDACIGQRAGKSVTFSFLEGYLIHKYLKMQKPSELLTGLPNVTLVATYTATDFKTATDTLWQPLCDIINESPWFLQYHRLLDYYSSKQGVELYKYMDSFLHYKHRKMFMSAAAPNKRNLRGRTRFSYSIDELGWFDASQESKDKVKISADEIYGALDRSMKTVRSAAKNLFAQGYDNIIPGIAFNISSPSSQQDKIMTLVRVHQNSRIVLPVHLPTWEFNPKEPKSNFTKEYDEDPVKAERDFGANPPMTDSPFIENEEMVRQAFSDKLNNKVEYEYMEKMKKGKDVLLKAAKATPRPHGDILPSLICIDAGYSSNSFAVLCLTRRDKDVHVEAAIEVIPNKGKSVLHYPKIFEDAIHPLIKGLNVQFITADRWNSIFLLQKCEEDFKIKWEQYSCKYADFNLFKSFLEGGRIKFPRLEMKPKDILQLSLSEYPKCFDYKPMSHLYLQLLTVSDTGKTVTKGTNRTDDIFRALVLGCHYLLDDEWVKENLKGVAKANSNRGVVALAGGSISGSVTTVTGKGVVSLG